MNPEPQFIHHLIYRPKRPKPHVMVGAAQQEMYHLQLISKVDEREWERSAAGKKGGGYQAAGAEDERGGEGVLCMTSKSKSGQYSFWIFPRLCAQGL